MNEAGQFGSDSDLIDWIQEVGAEIKWQVILLTESSHELSESSWSTPFGQLGNGDFMMTHHPGLGCFPLSVVVHASCYGSVMGLECRGRSVRIDLDCPPGFFYDPQTYQ